MKKLLTYKGGVVSILKGNFMVIGDALFTTLNGNQQFYLSSVEFDLNNAWVFSFISGTNSVSKNYSGSAASIRAIRVF